MSLGRLHPVKGMDLWIRAFASLITVARCGQDVRLVIAGSGDPTYESHLRTLASDSGVAERVQFVGQVDGAERVGAFSAGDIFAMPSHNENFGMSVVEAMAFGLAPIATEGVNIAPELAADRAALVVPYAVEPLAAAQRLLSTAPHPPCIGPARSEIT